jgi:hypothetical protein
VIFVTHLKCTKITVPEYTKLGESNETYFCKICTDRLPKFTDSYFGETSFRSNDNVFNLTGSSFSSTPDENNETYDIFNELTEQRKKHPETFTCAYLNINSIRYKLCSIKQLLTTNTVGMLIIAETIACFSMSFIFVLFMLHLLTVCALYVCLCDYVNICMYLVLLYIFGKNLLRACVYCYTKTEFK